MQFSIPVQRFIDDFAGGLGVDRTTFLENIVIGIMARLELAAENDDKAVLPEFTEVDGELLQGKELFEFLVEFNDDSDNSAVDDFIEGMAERAAVIQELKPRLRELQDEGLVPRDFYGHPNTAIRYVEMYKAGKLTRERLDEILSQYKRG